ncbi:MAG: hypothetical protein IJ131_03100 [Eggerthellaceae bacterium]|nr:hypothetical protein [Eggerthellaceae bacterium]
MGSGPGNIYEASNSGSNVEAKDRSNAVARKKEAQERASREITEDDIKLIRDRYGIDESGFIAEKGSKPNRRVIRSKDPFDEAETFFGEISKGAKREPKKGVDAYCRFPDGTTVTFRRTTSTPNSPAVEISNSASPVITNQKIHFIEEV